MNEAANKAASPRDWILAAFVLAVVLAAFWAALYLGERAVRPSAMTARPFVEFRLVDDNGDIAKTGRIYRAIYSPDPIYRAKVEESGPRVAFQIPFVIEKPDPDLAFFLAPTPGLQEIQLNGHVIQPNIPLDTLRGAADGRAVYYMLPADFLRPGGNEILVFVEAQSSILALAPFHIGPATEAARAAQMIELISNYLPTVAVSFLIFATLLCFVTNWPAQDRQRIRTLMVLMSVWALRTYFITFQTPFEVPFLITTFIYYLLEASVILAFARHLLAGEEQSGRWMRLLAMLWAALLVYLLVVTVAGFMVGPAIRDWFKYLEKTLAILTMLLAAAGLVALAYGIATRRDGRWMERIALMFCLVALVVDAGDSGFDLTVPFHPELPLTFYAAAAAGLLLGLGVVASIAREASEARRTVTDSNAILAARLTEQDAELSRSYDAQKQMLEKQVMLEERQRIVRDMHDGIGGQLLGLMMQLRGGGVEPKQVEEGLQSSIADLRLIVDSMDSAEGSLAETLRSFEHRARAQVEAAGIAFNVSHGLEEGKPGPGPRPTLQILRILQEAVTNAMRHSGATEIALDSDEDNEGNIRIIIRDNGKGIAADVKGGRGLISMRSRAETVGGVLEVQSNERGTSLLLEIPKSGGV